MTGGSYSYTARANSIHRDQIYVTRTTFMYCIASHSKLYHMCHHASFVAFATTHPTPLYVYTGPILMNSMKKSSKTSKNQPLSTCQVSCTKANTKYYYAQWMSLVPRQG